MKNTILFSFAFVAALAASIVLNDQSVSAVSGPCYYGGGTCSVAGVGDCGTNDVLPGRNTSCGGTPALNGVNTKAEFINRIINLSNNGGRTERGAKFIMRETTGTTDPARFRALLEQSNIDLVAVNDSGSRSSWYDPGKNDFFYDNYPGGWGSRPVLKIRQNGTVKSIIEVWCGNMAGNPVVVSPPANSTIRPNAELPQAGPYNAGDSVRVHTWVTKSGPDTRSNWRHVLWYDRNGDSVNNDGSGQVVDEPTGGPTLYPDGSTEIRDHNRTIRSGETRICVTLNLSGATDNVDGGSTSITGDPATDCRSISTPPLPEHDPTGSISVVCDTVSTSRQRITYSFNDQDGAATGSISSSSGYSASGLAETGGATVYHQPDTGGRTYTLTVTNPRAAGGFGTSRSFTATSPTCVNSEQPPTGWISVNICNPNSSNHLISYGGFSDPNGATQGQVTTTSSPANDVAGPTSSNGTATRANGGAVTYRLYVRDILANGTNGAWVNVASAAYNGAACPVTVTITPDANLLNGSGNVITGAVTSGTTVSTQTRVYNDGDVTTNSNWTRSFWYENNGNDTYNGGTDTPIAGSSTPLSGGPTNYSPLVYTSVAGNPSTSVDGTRTRICVSLSLSNPASNPITNISSNPSITCRSIIANPNELTPDVALSASALGPGEAVSATAEVECNPGTSTSSSNYRRLFWYDNGGSPSRYDDPSDVLVLPAPNDESGTATYCAANPFNAWGPVTVPLNGVTRACTSLQLTNPSPNATIPGSGIAVDCADVATKYFFQTTLGDVSAIGCLPTGCTAADTKISAFNSGSGSSYRGSGSQVAAFSKGAITEFTSSNNSSPNFTATNNPPKRLTFSNSTAGYGGGFSQPYNIPDYWAGATPGNAVVSGAPSEPLIINRTGDIRVTGSKTVSSVAVGNVPNLQWVISGGNIYIDRSVTTLNGVYIARGNIYTCSNGFSAEGLTSMATSCANPLRITGSLIAGGSVKLQRTAGSLTTTPAETIEYNPFVWMQGINPLPGTLPTITSSKLDFITTLPPIL